MREGPLVLTGALAIQADAVERTATCRCGKLRARCVGEPVRVSVCHCLDCQRRSGSAFTVQARFPTGAVRIDGAASEWTTSNDDGARTAFTFCPECGSTVLYRSTAMPEVTAIAVRAFADPGFPGPSVSGFEERRHAWAVVAGDGIAHFD